MRLMTERRSGQLAVSSGNGLSWKQRAAKAWGLLFLLTGGQLALGASKPPRFIEHTIATGLTGGYQVLPADLNHDGRPDVIALASGLPELVWYENPGWERHVIVSNMRDMINCVVLNVGGRPAIVLASGFSNVAARSAGNLWLLEPGQDVRQPWKARQIDRLPTSHRLRLADIDGSGHPVVVDAALTGPKAAPPNYYGNAPLVYYRPGQWRRTRISDQNPGVMHGICILDWDGDHRDDILIACFGGIFRYTLGTGGHWSRTELARGSPLPWPRCGASEIAVGHVGGHRFLCSIEPWHGNQVVVYNQMNGKWARHVIDDTFNNGHALATADLDHDGNDEIVAGYRGRGGGLVFYTAEDESGLRWKRHDLSLGGVAAASCAIVDLNGDSKPDILSIGASTANLVWFENKN